MEKSENFYVVIMAGGTGTRLWPLSRKEKPKQFQKFTSSKTMIQETYERVSKIVSKENILVSTTSQYKNLVKEQLSEISDKQLIIEPLPRGTAPAMALVASYISESNPEAIVATGRSAASRFFLSLDRSQRSLRKEDQGRRTLQSANE